MQKKLCFVIDLKRCIGCNTCVIACKMENSVPLGQFRMKVLTPQYSVLYDKLLGEFSSVHIHWIPIPCQHCDAAPCIQACPTGAMQKRQQDGIVVIEKDKCIGSSGCRSCFDVCPYDALFFNEETGTIDKCTMCANRIDKGNVPFCVIVCPCRAIHFGNLNDDNSHVCMLLKSREYEVLKAEQGTRPSVYYLLPSAFKNFV